MVSNHGEERTEEKNCEEEMACIPTYRHAIILIALSAIKPKFSFKMALLTQNHNLIYNSINDVRVAKERQQRYPGRYRKAQILISQPC